MPQAVSEPTETAENRLDVVTGVGVPVHPNVRVTLKVHVSGNVAVVPSCPLLLAPQQYSTASVAMPQVELRMLFALLGSTTLNGSEVGIAVGNRRVVAVVVPLPPVPNRSSPQQ